MAGSACGVSAGDCRLPADWRCVPGASEADANRRARRRSRSRKTEKPDESKATSGREVLDRMIIAYRKASSYADAGTVHLLAEAGGQKIIDETWNFSLTLVRPNKIRLQAYQAMLVCDGKKLYAAIGRPAGPGAGASRRPARSTLKTLFADRVLAMGLTQGVAGPMPQVLLLLADEPMKALLHDATRSPCCRSRARSTAATATGCSSSGRTARPRSGSIRRTSSCGASSCRPTNSASASAPSSRSIASRWWPISRRADRRQDRSRRRLRSRCPRARRS